MNSLISTVTFGFIDFKKKMPETYVVIQKIKESRLVQMFSKQNFLSTVDTSKKYMLTVRQKIGNYMEKYRDKNYLNKTNPNLMKGAEETIKKTNAIKEYLKKTRIFKSTEQYFNLFKLNKMGEMRNYVNSSKTKQKFYDYKLKFTSFFRNKSWKGYWEKMKNTSYSGKFKEGIKGLKQKISNFDRKSFTFGNMRRWFKWKFFKVLFFILGVYSLFYLIKYSFYGLKERRVNRQLREAYDLISDLKQQNNEIRKTNEELIKELQHKKKN